MSLWFISGCRTSGEPPAHGSGLLTAAEPEFTLQLRSEHGPRAVEGHSGRAALPAGAYLLEGWSARMRDRAGHRWEIERAPGEPARLLQVRSGGRTPLPLADPARTELVIEQNGGDVSFRLSVVGAAGETLGPVRKDGRPAPPPALRIEDARGHPVARLRGDDTCGGGCAEVWHPPAGLAQPLRAIPEVELGPFRLIRSSFRFRIDAQRTTSGVLRPADLECGRVLPLSRRLSKRAAPLGSGTSAAGGPKP